VAEAAKMADGWLAQQVASGQCELALEHRQEKCVLHGHCHQKALLGVSASAPALRLAPVRDETTFFGEIEQLKSRLDRDRTDVRADDPGP